jgi:DNA-binding FrmR family transcriptional regulator
MRRAAKDQDKLRNKLKRVEGQVRGISRMVEEDRYCIDILIQVQAARAALTNIGLEILENHAKGCVVSAVKQGDAAVIDELIDAAKKFIR